MTAPYLLGIDVSTTATKALLVDGDGVVAGVASAAYDLATPRPLWAEQDPELWWSATVDSVRALLADTGIAAGAIRGVGLTGQMHGLVPLDADGAVLRPAILWNDQRSAAECDEVRRRLGAERLVEITGNDAFPGFTAPKLLWVRRHEPEVWRRIARVLLPKDFVRLRLTGVAATDPADGGGTLLLDLAARDWSEEVLAALEIPPAWLPAVFEGTAVSGRVDDRAAAATGLVAGTPVVAGGGDQAAQAVGVGAVVAGRPALTLGTSGVVFAACPEPLTDPQGKLHAFPHAIPATWHVMGVMLSAAGSLRWYRDALAPGTDYDELLAEAAGVEPGCEGLTFLPYLSGERTPHADPSARGAFVGLTLRHGRGHLTRAVLEGVACGLRDNLELMAEVGIAGVQQVRISGGGSRSRLWRQILADVLGVDLVELRTTEGAAFGAALLAGIGADIWRSADDACSTAVRLAGVTRPEPRRRDVYARTYQRFRHLYPVLRPLFAAG